MKKLKIKYEEKPWGECFEVKVKNTKTHTTFKVTETRDIEELTLWISPETAMLMVDYIDHEIEKQNELKMTALV